MGDQYLTRPESDAHVPAMAGPGETTTAQSQVGQAAELGGSAPLQGTSAQGQASELNPTGEGETAAPAPPPAAAPTPAPTTVPYTVVHNDTLWGIARHQYGHGDVWRAIQQANEDALRRGLRSGTQLSLPADLDAIIRTCDHRATVQQAFAHRWNVTVGREAGAAQIPVETFRRVHAQLVLLPPGDVQGTWHRLLHLNNTVAAYMSRTGGEFGLGEEAAAREDRPYGTADMALAADAASGATTITLPTTTLVGPGVSLTLGTGADAETVRITAVNAARTEFTIDPALTRAHATGSPVVATHNRTRTVPWLETATRHEMGHAVNNAIGRAATEPLTHTLGGWRVGATVDDWIGFMSNPWSTTDGQVITDAEKTQIKQVVGGLASRPVTAGLDNGLATDHPILKYWNSGVPVIEAAKPMARHGANYWRNSGEYWGQSDRFFTINSYYGEFHAFGAELQYNQVRNYSTYSPAEFFAELYTVYYEEAAHPNPDLGRLIPVSSWRTWMTDHVHNRGHAPENAPAGEHHEPG